MYSKDQLPRRIRILYTDTYERAGTLEACYAFGHLYMNPEAKVALVEQHFPRETRRFFGVVGRVLQPDELHPNMRFCSLAGGVLAAADPGEAPLDSCALVLPAIFPERLRSPGATEVLLLGPHDRAFPSSRALARALAAMMAGYHQSLRAVGLPPYDQIG